MGRSRRVPLLIIQDFRLLGVDIPVSWTQLYTHHSRCSDGVSRLFSLVPCFFTPVSRTPLWALGWLWWQAGRSSPALPGPVDGLRPIQSICQPVNQPVLCAPSIVGQVMLLASASQALEACSPTAHVGHQHASQQQQAAMAVVCSPVVRGDGEGVAGSALGAFTADLDGRFLPSSQRLPVAACSACWVGTLLAPLSVPVLSTLAPTHRPLGCCKLNQTTRQKHLLGLALQTRASALH